MNIVLYLLFWAFLAFMFWRNNRVFFIRQRACSIARKMISHPDFPKVWSQIEHGPDYMGMLLFFTKTKFEHFYPELAVLEEALNSGAYQ